MNNIHGFYKEEMEKAKAKGKCVHCDYDSSWNEIYQDSLTGDWYMDIKTDEWDEYEDAPVYIRKYINFCPYCGREL